MIPNSRYDNGYYRNWERDLLEFVKAHPNSINIFWCSAFATAYDNERNGLENWILTDDYLDLRDEKNFLIYAAGTNIGYNNDGVFVNKIYNSEYACGVHGCYSLASLANSDKNTSPGSHVFVTVANQANGNIDQTNENFASTRFPVGFANNALFS